MGIGVIIDWYGPYLDIASLTSAAKEYSDVEKVVYMALGKSNAYNYIGLSTSAHSRFNNHEKIRHKDNRRYYIGSIESQAKAGKRKGYHPDDLKIAEHALVNYLQPKFNKDFKNTPPKDCTVIYSRFFDMYKQMDVAIPNPLPKFPTFIGFNSYSNNYE